MLMLGIENGRTCVKFFKDWNPAWLGRGYTPKPPAPVRTYDYYAIQRALLRGKKRV